MVDSVSTKGSRWKRRTIKLLIVVAIVGGGAWYLLGWLDLREAVKGDDLENARRILDNPVFSHHATDALFYARSGRMVDLLVSRGAAVTYRRSSGVTPLHCACGLGAADAVGALLARGALPNQQDGSGNTPLHWATDKFIDPDRGFDPGGWADENRRAVETAEILVAKGEFVDVRNSGGWTPLMNAASWNPSLVRFLLLKGADPKVSDSSGFTPLHLAAEASQGEVIRVLLEHGADPNARNWEGKTPLDCARDRPGFRDVVGVLPAGNSTTRRTLR